MDFTEAPEWLQEKIKESIEDNLGEPFDEDNEQHMNIAQELIENNWY